MKKAIAIVMASCLMAVLGCESPRGGGISSDQGFKIGTPMFDTKIKQGETESVTISLNRGKHFKRDVTLEIRASKGISKGISVEPTRVLVKGSDTPEVHLRITAARDTDLGEYRVFVTGTPDTGETTSTEITVKVVSP